VWLFPGRNPINPVTQRQGNGAVIAEKTLPGITFADLEYGSDEIGECNHYRSYTKGVLGGQFWTSAACRMVVRNMGPAFEPGDLSCDHVQCAHWSDLLT